MRLTQILQSLNRGKYGEPTTLTVAEYLDLWLRNYVEVSVCPRVPLQCVVFALVLPPSKCRIIALIAHLEEAHHDAPDTAHC